MQSKYNIKEVIVIKFCENCGYQLEDNAHFCEECGCIVEQDDQSAPIIEPNIPTEAIIIDQKAGKGVNNEVQNIGNGAINYNIDTNDSFDVPNVSQNVNQNNVTNQQIQQTKPKKPKKPKKNKNKGNQITDSVIDNQELNKKKQIKIIALIISLVIILLGATAAITSYVVDNKNNNFGKFSSQWGTVNVEASTESITEAVTEEKTEEITAEVINEEPVNEETTNQE